MSAYRASASSMGGQPNRSVHGAHKSARHEKPPHRIYAEHDDVSNDEPVAVRENEHALEPHWGVEHRLLSGRANVAVSILGVVLLIAQLIEIEDGHDSNWDLAHVTDGLFCIILLADFMHALIYAPNRKRFLRRNWWEPLASIPMIDTAGHGMLAVRILRILRLLRIFKLHVSIREYARDSQEFLERNRITEVGSILGLTIVTGALGFFYAEQGVNPNVHSFRDGVWWAMVTVTTIGYGDIYPVTTVGRAIAVVLMVIGIGTVSLFTGMIAAGLLRDNRCPHCGERV